MNNTRRVWLVERTFSDDEQNIIILTYATRDGSSEFRKERAITSFSGTQRGTPVSLVVDQNNLAEVTDPVLQDQYAQEATRMADKYTKTEKL